MAPDPDSKAQIYLTVLKHTNLDTDWKAFAKEVGISNTGNAQRKFRQALKTDGFQLSNGKVIPLDGNGDSSNTPATPSKRKKPANTNGESSAKKRKAKKDVVENDEEKDVADEGDIQEDST